MKRKITITTGTRADYGILRPVIQQIKNSRNLDFHLIVTGMHLHKKYGKTIDLIKSDGYNVSSIIRTNLVNDSLVNNSINYLLNLFNLFRLSISKILKPKSILMSIAYSDIFFIRRLIKNNKFVTVYKPIFQSL